MIRSQLQTSPGFAAFAVLSAVATMVGAAEPFDAQAAQREFEEAYRHEDWARAISVGHELVRALPERAVPPYNLACVYARAGDAEKALHWLGEAAARGFRETAQLEADGDLGPVRILSGYGDVVAAVAANLRQHRAQLQDWAAESPVLLVPPSSYDPSSPAPLVVVFHGYGDTPLGYPHRWEVAAERSRAVLAVPLGGLRVGAGFGWSSVDEADAILSEVLARASSKYAIDRDRVVVTGFSQGAFMALALGVRHPDGLRGVIPIAGPYIPEVDAPPPASPGRPRYFFMAGSQDPAVTQMRRAARDFEAAGYDTRFRILPGIGHAMPDRDAVELREALRWVMAR